MEDFLLSIGILLGVILAAAFVSLLFFDPDLDASRYTVPWEDED